MVSLSSLNYPNKSNLTIQPPKRRGSAKSGTRNSPSASASASTPKKPRQSKLAKENEISGAEENEIKEVFHLFSAKQEGFEGEKEGVIPRGDVRKALVYVCLPACPTPNHLHGMT